LTTPYTKNRNHQIDLLRFFSACWVVLFHFNEPIIYIDNWYRNFCKLGYLGVPVFFILSGFCIGIAQKHVKSPVEFIIRRLFRIFPPYWFSVLVVLVCALCVMIITGTNSTPLPKSLSGVIATLCLYTAPLSHFKAINWVYWTLPYEMFFYVLMFLALIPPPRFRTAIPFLLIIVSLVLPIQKEGILFFFDEIPVFMLGYALYVLTNGDENPLLNILLLPLSIAGTILKHHSLVYLLTCLLTIVLIFIDSKKPLNNNFFSRMGDFSYSVYLLHIPIGIYLLGFIKENWVVQHSIILNILCDFSLLMLILLIAKIAFKRIELPAIGLGKTAWMKIQKSSDKDGSFS
jgi:peptidoglycan/LPS O-acetylase OafA/YrhL